MSMAATFPDLSPAAVAMRPKRDYSVNICNGSSPPKKQCRETSSPSVASTTEQSLSSSTAEPLPLISYGDLPSQSYTDASMGFCLNHPESTRPPLNTDSWGDQAAYSTQQYFPETHEPAVVSGFDSLIPEFDFEFELNACLGLTLQPPYAEQLQPSMTCPYDPIAEAGSPSQWLDPPCDTLPFNGRWTSIPTAGQIADGAYDPRGNPIQERQFEHCQALVNLARLESNLLANVRSQIRMIDEEKRAAAAK